MGGDVSCLVVSTISHCLGAVIAFVWNAYHSSFEPSYQSIAEIVENSLCFRQPVGLAFLLLYLW